jgi:hypothetical protein
MKTNWEGNHRQNGQEPQQLDKTKNLINAKVNQLQN